MSQREYSANAPLLSLYARANRMDHCRFAVACSSKIAKAVTRNKMRRIVLAAFADIKHKIAIKCDFYFRFRQLADKSQINEFIRAALSQNKLIAND